MTGKESVASLFAAFGGGLLSGIWWPNNMVAGAIAGALATLIVLLLSRRLGLFQ